MYHIVVGPGSHQAHVILFPTHVCWEEKAAAVNNAGAIIFNVDPFRPALNANMGIVPFNDNGNKIEVEAHVLHGNPFAPVVGSTAENRDTLIRESLFSGCLILNYGKTLLPVFCGN